jgi:hypothetical protein
MFNAGSDGYYKDTLYRTSINGYPLVTRTQDNIFVEDSGYGLNVRAYEVRQTLKVAQTFTLEQPTEIFFGDFLAVANYLNIGSTSGYSNNPDVLYDAYIFPTQDGVPLIQNPLVYLDGSGSGVAGVSYRRLFPTESGQEIASNHRNSWYNNGVMDGSNGVELPAGTYTFYVEFMDYFYYDSSYCPYRADDLMVRVPFTIGDQYTGGALYVAGQETWSSDYTWTEVVGADLYFQFWNIEENEALPPASYTGTYIPTTTSTGTSVSSLVSPGITLPDININVDWDNEGVHWLILIVGIAAVAILCKGEGPGDKRPLFGTVIIVVMLAAAAITKFVDVWFVVLVAIALGIVIFKFLKK